MFRVRNQMPGPYNLILEKGSITINQGKSFDIEGDGKCSRGWINSDPFLKRALDNGNIALVYDSEKKMGKTPIGSAMPDTTTKKSVVEKPEPKIIDFGKGEDLPEEEFDEEEIEPVEAVSEPEPEPKESGGPFEDLEPMDKEEIEEPSEELPDVWKDKKANLLEWAIDKDIELPDDPTKTQIKDAILASPVYQDLKEAWGNYKNSLEE